MESKIEKRVRDMYNKNNFDEDFVKVTFDKIVENNILPYQYLHVLNLVSALKKSNTTTVVDGSTTGLGKTYTAIATCKQLNLRPFIICPMGIMGNWENVCNTFDVIPLGIVNYELIRNGKEYNNGVKTKSTHITKENKTFKWTFENIKNSIVIFDEAHKCKNESSLNGKLLMSLKNVTRVMLLSATLCDKSEDFLLFGYMLGFYENLKKGKNWIQGIIRDDKNKFTKESTLSKHLFPDKGSKMGIDDLGKKIPPNIISSELYTIDKKSIDIINNEYLNIKNAYENSKGNKLIEIIKSRKIIEKYKIPVILDLCYKYLELEKHIVIFVNFLETLEILKHNLNECNISFSFIEGGQTLEEREQNILLFQENKNKVILCMIQAGSISISLHDLTGRNPRVSIISPSLSCIDLIQALGRIYRSGVKSQVLQKLVFCDKTYETNICNIIRNKINFLDKLTDDELVKF
jgi:SNF2 family DNA or RNA helicase